MNNCLVALGILALFFGGSWVGLMYVASNRESPVGFVIIAASIVISLALALARSSGERRRRRSEKEAADSAARAQALAAAQKKQEVEDILGKYAGGSDNPGRSATYTDNLTDAQISQGREMDMDLHGRIMG